MPKNSIASESTKKLFQVTVTKTKQLYVLAATFLEAEEIAEHNFDDDYEEPEVDRHASELKSGAEKHLGSEVLESLPFVGRHDDDSEQTVGELLEALGGK